MYILLMLASIAVNYMFGRLIGVFQKMKTKAGRKICLILAVIANIGVLGVFKYTGFIVENLNHINGINIKNPNIALPIGISFFTFQALSCM